MNTFRPDRIHSPPAQNAHRLGLWFQAIYGSCDQRDCELRLVCFHHAGGCTQFFRGWSAHMPLGVQVVAVELPGRGRRLRETGVPSIAELAERIAEAWVPELGATIPFVTLGHSMGGLLSLEVLLRLATRGLVPRLVGISALGAPGFRSQEQRLSLASDAEIIAQIRDLGGTPAAVLADRDFMASVCERLRMDYHAIETFRPTPWTPLNSPLAVVGGAQDPLVSRMALDAWWCHAGERFYRRDFPGGHFFLKERAAEVLEWLMGIARSGPGTEGDRSGTATNSLRLE
ncbi:MAG: alpha/beta fold hydrolase [Nannocystaceae bacterium]